jgi:hypothetical protein
MYTALARRLQLETLWKPSKLDSKHYVSGCFRSTFREKQPRIDGTVKYSKVFFSPLKLDASSKDSALQ